MNSPAKVKLLLIFLDENDTLGELPLYEAIVRYLRQQDIAGATVSVGIMGFGGHGKVHRKGLFGIPDDRPVTISVADQAEKIERVLPELHSMVKEGLLLLLDAQVVT